MNSLFTRYQQVGAPVQTMRGGALVASEAGKAVTFGLNNAEQRGVVFCTRLHHCD
jgi:GTP-binding protein